MNKYPLTDPWCLVEEGFDISDHLASESTFSIGNGQIRQFGNFEEYYSGETISGTYITGINNSEKVKFLNLNTGKIKTTDRFVNAPDWVGIIVRLNEEKLDLAVCEVINYKRVLNMKDGFLERTFEVVSMKGHHIKVAVKRFVSMADKEVGAISYSIKSINFAGRITFMPLINGDINETNNENEPIWNVLQTKTQQDVAHLWTNNRHTDFHVCSALSYDLYKNNELLNVIPTKIEKEKVVGFSIGADIKTGDTLYLIKYIAIVNSMNYPHKELTERACELARVSKHKGWNKLCNQHSEVMTVKWIQLDSINEQDIEIHQAKLYEIFRSFQGLDNL